MKKNYISGRRLSLWMRLTAKWNSLYTSIKKSSNSKKLEKLNNLSLLLGVKRKIAITALAGAVTLGAQAQVSFERLTFNSGEQTFSNLGISGYSRPVFVDLDQDGDEDLVIGDINGSVKYYTNDNNSFTEQSDTNNPFSEITGYWSAPAFADVDNDGDLDLALGHQDGEVFYYTNNNSVFTEQTGINNPFSGIDTLNLRISTPNFGDVNGDGQIDLLLGEINGILHYFTNNNGEFTEQTGTDNPFNGIDVGLYSAPTLQDIDNDNDLDLTIGNLDGEIVYLENNGDETFTQKLNSDNPFENITVSRISAPAFTDLDGDNDLDLVVGSNTGILEGFENDNNDFSTPINSVNIFDNFTAGFYAKLTFVDLDNDGDLDLVSGLYDGTLNYFINDNNVFTEQTGTNNPFDSIAVEDFARTVFADLDNDGDLDLAIGEAYGDVSYFTNQNNVFTEQDDANNPFSVVGDLNTFRVVPEFIDLNNDGDLDLLVTDANTEQTGSNNPFETLDVGTYNSQALFVDLDNDGDQDLVVSEYYGDIFYFTNNNNVFTEQTGSNNPFDNISAGFGGSIAFSDLDNDGKLNFHTVDTHGKITEYRNTSVISGLSFNKELESLNIFPNPASSIINTEEGTLEILDLTGHLVLSTESNGQVDVSDLESGIYIVILNGKKTKLVVE